MTGSATWRRLTVKGRVTPPLECAKVTVKVECRSRPKHVSCVGVNEVTFSIALSTIRWFFMVIKDCGGFFVFSMKALKKVEKCNELIDIHWPIKGPERHFALMVSPYMYNIYTMRIINNLLTRKAKRKMKRRKKKQCLLLLLQMPPRILLFLEYWRRGFSHWSSPPGMGSSTGSCSPATSEGSAFSAQKRLNCHKYLHINWKEKKI